MNDQEYMKRALALAERGCGWTSPNPMVGAVIVRDGRILAEGWHARYGELHAERAALANATEDVRGATMYVMWSCRSLTISRCFAVTMRA